MFYGLVDWVKMHTVLVWLDSNGVSGMIGQAIVFYMMKLQRELPVITYHYTY